MDRFNLLHVLNCRVSSLPSLLLCVSFLSLLCFCFSELAWVNFIMLFLKQFWFLANARFSHAFRGRKPAAAPQHATANFERCAKL